MSKNSKLISENLREEIAKEFGVYEQVIQEKKTLSIAIEIANRSIENK